MSEVMATDEKIGKYIKKLREEKNVTQEELANAIHVSRNGLSDIEHGKTKLSVDRALALADIFGISIVEIYNAGELNEKNINKTIEEINETTRKNIKRKYKILILVITSLFLAIVLGFLSYYFFNSYNSIKIYKVEGRGENFKTNTGLLIISKENIHFNLSVEELREKKAREITLYQIKNGKEELVAKTDNANSFYLVDFYNYEAYLNYNDVVNNKITLKLIINYDGGSEEINLDITKEYENKRVFFQKRTPISEDSTTNNYKEIGIPEKVIKEFTHKNDSYSLIKKEKNYEVNLTYFPDSELIILRKENDECDRLWRYRIRGDFMNYNKYCKNGEPNEEISIVEHDSEIAKEFYEEYNKYFS